VGKAWPWLAGILAVVSLVADIDQLIGIPRVALGLFPLAAGFAITIFGTALFAREWNKPLRWQATKAAAVAAAGTALVSVSVVGLVPALVTRGDGYTDRPGVPTTLSYYGKADLDPEIAGSSPDVHLYGNDPLTFLAVSGTVFARVSSPSSAGCDSARDWMDSIKPVQDSLICVRTDLQRYVILDILSVGSDQVTFRVVYESPSPAPPSR
jgi:hypothetical protein